MLAVESSRCLLYDLLALGEDHLDVAWVGHCADMLVTLASIRPSKASSSMNLRGEVGEDDETYCTG